MHGNAIFIALSIGWFIGAVTFGVLVLTVEVLGYLLTAYRAKRWLKRIKRHGIALNGPYRNGGIK